MTRKRIFFWLAGTAGFLLIGLFARLAFQWLNAPADLPSGDVGRAYWLGARFDASVAGYAFVLPWLVWTLASLVSPPPALQKFGRAALIALLTVFGAAVIFLSMIDTGYYGFYQDRLNALVFGFIEDDTWALVKTFWKNYPVVWMFLGLVILIGGQALAWRKLAAAILGPVETRARTFGRRLGSFAAGFALFLATAVLARGSLGLFPLGDLDTHISAHPFVNLLAFNSTHAFGRAVQNKIASHAHWDSNMKMFGYAGDPRRAWADYFEIPPEQVPEDPRQLMHRTSAENKWARDHKPHVLVLVMESLGGYWLRYDQEPFDLIGPTLRRHFDEDILWTHFLSGSGATIGSLSALMAGVPHRPHSDFLTEGPDLATAVRTAPARVFRSAGYETRFVYAGNPGWRDISKYAALQGFQAIDGDVDIEKQLGRQLPRHDWGLFDEDVWESVEKRLEAATAPQFILVMTTANHPPYQLSARFPPAHLEVPDELSRRLIGDRKVASQRFLTFRNSNDRLGDLLDRLEKRWGDQVAVAATGDHGFWIVNFDESQQMQKNSVPLYLKLPKPLAKKADRDRFGQHVDLWPTLYEALLDKADYDTLSNDLLDPASFETAVNFGRLALNRDGGVFVGDRAEGDRGFKWEGNFEALRPSEMTEGLARQGRKYRALMSLLDDYFKREKQR